MKTASIDLSRCVGRAQLYEELRRALNLPAGCGANLDALWDCLSEGACLPLCLEVRGEAPDALQEYLKKVYRVLDDARPLGLAWRRVR